MRYCSLGFGDHLPAMVDVLTSWASDVGFGSCSITTPKAMGHCQWIRQNEGLVASILPCLLVCLDLWGRGRGVPASSPQPIPLVTQCLRRKPWLLGPFPNGTVSQAALLLPVSKPTPFPRDRDGCFPLWLCPKGRNIFLWLTKAKGEVRKWEEARWGLEPSPPS